MNSRLSFEIIKKRLRAEMKFKDPIQVCKRLGTPLKTYHSAMETESFSDLSDIESEVIDHLYTIITARRVTTMSIKKEAELRLECLRLANNIYLPKVNSLGERILTNHELSMDITKLADRYYEFLLTGKDIEKQLYNV